MLKWLLKLRIKHSTNKINMFIKEFTALDKQRIYVTQEKVNMMSKHNRKIIRFFNSKFYFRLTNKSEFSYLEDLKKDFFNAYENLHIAYESINKQIEMYELHSTTFLDTLNLLKANPEEQEPIYLLLEAYRPTYSFITTGDDKRLVVFSNLLKYYDHIDSLIDTWCLLKKYYQDTLEFVKYVKLYKLGYIDNVKLTHLVGYKEALTVLSSREFQDEVVWNKKIISRSSNFLGNIDDEVKKHNFDYLNKVISDDFLDKNDSNIDKLIVTNKIKKLMLDENVTIYDIEQYFNSKHSRIDDRYEDQIQRKLKSIYPESKILTNTYVDTNYENIPYCQIDIILFLKGEIYVLELKDYTGKIYGSYSAANWKQIFVSNYRYRNNRKVYTRVNKQIFKNPIKQNAWHIQSLKKIYSYNYKNIVLFSDQSELFISADNVFIFQRFINYLEIQPSKPCNQSNEIYYRLCLLNKGLDRNVRNDHIESIRRKNK